MTFRRAMPMVATLLYVAYSGTALGQQQTVGLFLNDPGAFDGYTLFSPIQATTTHLIDNHGRQVHSWESTYPAGVMAYLMENGHLLRSASLGLDIDPRFQGSAGFGGRVEEFDWDGTLVWEFEYSNEEHLLHHDLEVLPNGNYLMMAWEYKTSAEAVAAGRDPGTLTAGALWPEVILEVQPTGPTSGTIVWEWRVWDHLIQEFDPTRSHFGVVADHPERIDLNHEGITPGEADWNHFNGMAYNPVLDQIVVSVHRFSEFWVIDHSTTTAEAAGHTGGDSGKGGDLLYRWGNPAAYHAGGAGDQKLFRQHDAQWIPPGHPGAGNFLVFNNGAGRPPDNYSTVDEILSPVDGTGAYPLDPGPSYPPADPLWSYVADSPTDLFAPIVSGAQRLPNGNTLFCDGPRGTIFEVMSNRDLVWRYVNPVTSGGPLTQGDPIDGNIIFKMRRYAADYPGLAGQDLTPSDPIESFTNPHPVPDGSNGTVPLIAERTTVGGDEIGLAWDAASCPATGYNLLYGDLADVGAYTSLGAECGIGTFGTFAWTSVPAGNLYFLVVGTDPTLTYESSWGTDGTGAERNTLTPSGLCGVTVKDVAESCP